MIRAAVRRIPATANGRRIPFSSMPLEAPPPPIDSGGKRKRCSRRSLPAVSEQEAAARLSDLQALGFAEKELSRLRVSITRGIDLRPRLRLLAAVFQDLGIDESVQRRIICQQKSWLFHSPPPDFAASLHSFRALLLIYHRNTAKLGSWLVQLQPAPHHKYDETLQFLVRLGGGEAAARRMIQRFPLVLQFDVESQLKPRLQLIRDLGLSEEQAARMIVRYPRILASVRGDRFNSVLALLRETGLSGEDISKMFANFPALCTTSSESLSRRIDFFVSCGVERQKVRHVLRRNPSVISLSLETGLKPKLEFLMSVGIDVARLLGIHSGVLARSRDALCGRYEQLIRAGLTREESSEVLSKHPSIFNLRNEAVEEKLGFYTRVMKKGLNSIVRLPSYLTYSLEARIKPRMKFQCWLYLSGLAKREYLPSYFLFMREDLFASKFLVSDETLQGYRGFQPVGSSSSSRLQTTASIEKSISSAE